MGRSKLPDGKGVEQPPAGQENTEPEQVMAMSPSSGSPKNPSDRRFIGVAMKTLFEASDVSIARGDETRVLSRAQQALAELQRRNPASAEPAVTQSTPDSSLEASNAPLKPRVDAVLWLVLAAGLFAIAGWILAYGL